MLLAINKEPITCFRDIENSCQDLDKSEVHEGKLNMTIFRQVRNRTWLLLVRNKGYVSSFSCCCLNFAQDEFYFGTFVASFCRVEKLNFKWAQMFEMAMAQRGWWTGADALFKILTLQYVHLGFFLKKGMVCMWQGKCGFRFFFFLHSLYMERVASMLVK